MVKFLRVFGFLFSLSLVATAAGWGTPSNLTQTSTQHEYSQYAHCGGVAADTGGNLHVTWYAAVNVNKVCYRRRSSADGSWGTVETVSTSNSLNSLRGGVAADFDGNVHVVWLRNTPPYCGVWYRRRSAATGTWSSEQLVATKHTGYAPGEPSIATRPGGNQLHLVWTQRCSSGVAPTYTKVWHREFDGSAWGPITMVSVDTATAALNAGVAVDSANNVHITWQQYGNGVSSFRVWYRARLNGVWQPIEQVSSAELESYSQYNPDIEVSATGVPHVVWHGQTPSAPLYFRILYRTKTEGAWAAIETCSVFNSAHNRFPGIALVGETAHVVWRRDSTGSSVYSHLRYRARTGAGQWSSDVRLSPANWVSFAWYAAVTAWRGDVHLVWHDSWNGSTAGFSDVWYLRRAVEPDLDYAAVSVDSVWPFQPRNGTARVAATVRNTGRLAQPAGKKLILTIGGPNGYDWSDTAYTSRGLLPGESESVVFPLLWSVPAVRGHYVLSVISGLEGDENPENDTARFQVEVYPGLYETFTATTFPPSGWHRYNFDQSDPWTRHTAYSFTAPACARVYFDTPNNDWLITPALGPIGPDDDSLVFYFRADQPNYYETLTVRIATRSQTDTTAFGAVVGRFVTSGTTAWRRLAYSLAPWRDSTVYLAFVYKNYDAFGVAIDDVMGPKLYQPLRDMAVDRLHCTGYPLVVGSNETLSVVVRNRGTLAATTWRVRLAIDGQPVDSLEGTSLAPGESAAVFFLLNPSVSRRAVFAARVVLVGDENPLNDSIALDDWIFPRNTVAAQGFDLPYCSSFPPPGWARFSRDGGAQQWEWREEPGREHSGLRHSGVRWESALLRNDDWLVSNSFTPTATGTDTIGFFWRAYDRDYPESLEVFVMSGQNGPADTLARIFAASTRATEYGATKLCLDAWDERPIHIGFRYPSLDAWFLLIDDVWWQITRGGPGVPVLAAPPDDADSQPAAGQLVWHPAFNTDVYDVLLDTVFPPAQLLAEGLVDTVVEYAGLLPWRRYWWRVDARNRAGRTVSQVWSFTTIGPDTTAPGWREISQVPLLPSGKAVGDGGALAWDDASGSFFVLKGQKTSDCWRFDPVGSSWLQLPPVPAGNENKLPGKGAAVCGDGSGTVYLLKGNNTVAFWSYRSDSATWTALADVPLGVSNKRVKGGGDMVYVAVGETGFVYLLKGNRTEFYRYNAVTGVWQTVEPAPTGARAKWDRGSWLAYDNAGRIYAHKAKIHEFYCYDIATGQWQTAGPGMPLLCGQTGKSKKSKDGADGVALGSRIYALKGGNTCDFYAFEPVSASWVELETIPSFGSSNRKKRVKGGGGLATDGLHIWALKGNKTAELWRYVPGGTSLPAGRRQEKNCRPAVSVTAAQLTAEGRVAIRLADAPALQPLAITLYDAAGRVVLTRKIIPAEGALVLPELPRGVYLMQAVGPGQSRNAKLVIGHGIALLTDE